MTLRWYRHCEERLNQTSIHIDLIVVKNFFGNFSFGISPSGGFQFDTYGGIFADDLDALQGLLIEPYSQNNGQNHHNGEHHVVRSEEHTSELQSRENIVCRLLL